MNKITKWTPIENVPPTLSVNEVVYGAGGLKIFLKEPTISGLLLINFKSYLGFRIFDESYRLRTIYDNEILISHTDPWTLFVSDECEIIDWLKTESLNIVDSSREIKNYIININLEFKSRSKLSLYFSSFSG